MKSPGKSQTCVREKVKATKPTPSRTQRRPPPQAAAQVSLTGVTREGLVCLMCAQLSASLTERPVSSPSAGVVPTYSLRTAAQRSPLPTLCPLRVPLQGATARGMRPVRILLLFELR